MNCREARARLVAWQDEELSPGETTQVEEHLSGCDDCAVWEEHLARATPAPCIATDLDHEAALWERLDEAVAHELEHPRELPAPSALERLQDWLSEETPVPTGVLVAYAAALILALGWGLSNWMATRAVAPPPADVASQHPEPVNGPASEIPASQFRPASWRPDDDTER